MIRAQKMFYGYQEEIEEINESINFYMSILGNGGLWKQFGTMSDLYGERL